MVKDNSYVVIQSFMVNELNLKGNELIVYAVIYGYTQDGEHWFYGTRGHLAEWCGATKSTVTNCLKTLLDKGLLEREEKNEYGVIKVRYRVVKNSAPLSKIDPTLIKISSINNKEHTNNNKEIERAHPSYEEVENYLKDKGATSDYAELFFNHYNSQGWKKGNGNPITDWKALVKQWLNKDKITSAKVVQYPDETTCPDCGRSIKRLGNSLYVCVDCDRAYNAEDIL